MAKKMNKPTKAEIVKQAAEEEAARKARIAISMKHQQALKKIKEFIHDGPDLFNRKTKAALDEAVRRVWLGIQCRGTGSGLDFEPINYDADDDDDE